MTAHNEYGYALFLLAKEEGALDATRNDAVIANELLRENEGYVKLLDTPALSKDEKTALIDEAFGTLSYSVLNLLKILCEKRCVHSFAEVFDTYFSEYDREMGIERVEAVTAVKMTEGQIANLSKKLQSLTGKTVVIKNTVSPEILGGVKLRYSGIQIDGSVKSRLDAFSENLKNIVI